MACTWPKEGGVLNFLATPARRKFLFAALYASEGAPIGFLWWALPTKLRALDVPVETVTRLSAVLALPWAFKFLWAPLVDVLRGPRWSRRSWALTAQLMMGLTLMPLLWLDLRADFSVVVVVLIVHALTAATQDVSIDALAVANTTADERGSINGWMQAGMLTSRALFGGATLILAESLGERGTVLALIVTVWCSSILLLMSPEPHPAEGQAPASLRAAAMRFGSALREMLRRRTTWLGLAFAAIGGAAFESVGAVAGPFLLDRGLTQAHVGWFFTIFAVACPIGGALAGGYVSDRLGRRRTVALFLVLCAAAVLVLAGLDPLLEGPALTSRYASLAAVYLCFGLFTAAQYALFMDLTDPRLGATQFSAFMGATNLCESASAFSIGRLHARLDYPGAFAVMAAVSLVALPLLRGLPARINRRQEAG